MTPDERQLLTGLVERVIATPAQTVDEEADLLIRRLSQRRPDTAYILAQTVLMQDFALRNAQAQIAQLQQQLDAARAATPKPSGSFLGNLLGGGSVPAAGRPGPWGAAAAPPAYAQPGYAQPGYAQPAYAPPQATYAAPVMQPGQTSGFLRGAAQTAVGIAGGALLFEGIQSIFGHHGGFGMPGGYYPPESLTETTIVNNYYDTPSAVADAGPVSDPGGGFVDAGYDGGVDPGSGDFDGDDSSWT